MVKVLVVFASSLEIDLINLTDHAVNKDISHLHTMASS